MKVIGIDPGIAGTGIGIVSGSKDRIDTYAYGSISTSKHDLIQNRLNLIFTKIKKVIKLDKPDLIIIEDVFSLDKYPKSSILLGKVTGVILLAVSQLGIPLKEVSVCEAKYVLTGNGGASKRQIEMVVRNILTISTPIRPYHASDALGLALVGLYRHCW